MSREQTAHPTGFSPSNLPFYTELDDQEFERFCTDLLNLHPVILCLRDGRAASRRVVKAERLLSGTAQAGVDIRVETDHGEVWFAQCKRVKLAKAAGDFRVSAPPRFRTMPFLPLARITRARGLG